MARMTGHKARMSNTSRILLGLVAGLALGAILLASGAAFAPGAAAVIEPVGAVWLNALKMTIIPLDRKSVV